MCDRCGYDEDRHGTYQHIIVFRDDDGRMGVHSEIGSLGEDPEVFKDVTAEDMVQTGEHLAYIGRRMSGTGARMLIQEEIDRNPELKQAIEQLGKVFDALDESQENGALDDPFISGNLDSLDD